MAKSHSKFLVAVLIMAITVSMTSSILPSVHAGQIVATVSPISGQVGSTATVHGTNATANSEVRLYLFGVLYLTSTTTDGDGNYSANFTVPPIPQGTYPIEALDMSSNNTAYVSFTVNPKITLSSTTGSFDDAVKAKGDGFKEYSNITLRMNGIDITPYPSPQTDVDGSFDASFYVPSMPNGTYPFVAIDELGNAVSSPFIIVPEVTLQPTSGNQSTLVLATGYGFASFASFNIHFGSIDLTPYSPFITSAEGSFQMPFFVPDVPDGTYLINVSDNTGNTAFAPFLVPSPSLVLTPARTSGSSIVTANGTGFQPSSPVILYLENIEVTNMVDLTWSSPSMMPDKYGSFGYAFIVPITRPGIYTVAAFQAFGPSPSDLRKMATTSLTVSENDSLSIQVNVGSLCFRGELAEFYVQTTLEGRLVSANIYSASLSYSNGSLTQDLRMNVTQISTGLFRIPYAVSNNAPVGTYVLSIKANYRTALIQTSGTALGSFLLNPTLTAQNAELLSIDNEIGTIIVPELGAMQANLSAINAKLVSINGTQAILQSDIGLLKTNVQTINATLSEINGTIATILSDVGTLTTSLNAIHAQAISIGNNTELISSDVGSIKTQLTGKSNLPSQAEMTTMVLALIAAAGGLLSAILIFKRKPQPPSISSDKSLRPDTPKEQTPRVAQEQSQEKPSQPTESGTTTQTAPQESSQHETNQSEASSTSILPPTESQPMTQQPFVLAIPPETPAQIETSTTSPQEDESQQQT